MTLVDLPDDLQSFCHRDPLSVYLAVIESLCAVTFSLLPLSGFHNIGLALMTYNSECQSHFLF